MAFLQGRIAPAYLEGARTLELCENEVPQVTDIGARLGARTGAGVKAVPAIIAPRRFLTLLSQRKFPVATFLRRKEDIDYIEEPDLFHEIFGHCPLLTESTCCDFIEGFGLRALALGKDYSWHMLRLFRFTVELGMIATPDGPRAYGAGIASSPSEARRATGPNAILHPFDLKEVLRSAYRIDVLQPVYFEISGFQDLTAALDGNLAFEIDRARELGDLPPRFDAAA